MDPGFLGKPGMTMQGRLEGRSRIKSGMTMRGFRFQIELVGISMSFLQGKQESRVSNGPWIPGARND